jgi:predicted DNA-binding protein (MmcQ/YjbR family)
MTHQDLEKYLLSKKDVFKDFPFGEDNAVYKVGNKEKSKMFAIVAVGSDPINISLKCDPVLADDLRAKYESVMPGYHLNKKHWNTIVVTGQLSDDEIYSLVDHSYQLVTV